MENSERITTESLKQDAQISLEDYYEKREELIKQIGIFQEAIDDARMELTALNKKYKKLLQKTGAFKTNTESIYDIIASYPDGITAREAIKVFSSNADFFQSKNPGEYFRSTLPVLIASKCVEYKERKYQAVAPYKRLDTPGISGFIKEALQNGPKTTKEIIEYIQKVHNVSILAVRMISVVKVLEYRSKVTTNRAFKNQRGVIYTWIGETD